MHRRPAESGLLCRNQRNATETSHVGDGVRRMLFSQIARNVGSHAAFLRTLSGYLRISPRNDRVRDTGELAHFLQTRASHVAQTSLYGYLRTRAGTMYPELFENDAFMVSVNIAKWQVWLACLSDLAIYAGGLIRSRTAAEPAEVRDLVAAAVGLVLNECGEPAEAGDGFPAAAAGILARVARTDWTAVADDGSAFSESPGALVRHAPIIDSLKELDSAIVKNSVRFRWQEIRRALRRGLDADAVLVSWRSADGRDDQNSIPA